MKTLTSFILLALWTTVFLPSAATAQDTQDKTIKVRFRVFGWDDAPSDLHYALRSKDTQIQVIQDSRSVFYDYTGPAVIAFYRLKTDSKGKIVREIACQANLEKAGSWPLILLARNRDNPTKYDTRMLRDDLSSFPAGSYAFSNFSTTPLIGSLGGQVFNLPPAGEQLIEPKTSEDVITLFAVLVKMENDRKVPVYTNNWAIRPARRTRVFVKASDESPSGLVSIRVVESTVFPTTKEDGITQAE